LLRELKEAEVPQATQGIGPLGGVVGTSSPQDTLNINSKYKGGTISSPNSPPDKQAGRAKTKETSMATRVHQIALTKSGEFTVDEITGDLVKSSFISPPPTTPEEWASLKKRVSNTLGRMVMLVRVKNGTYRRPAEASEYDLDISPEYEPDSGRLRILRVIPKPLPIRLPLDLHQYVLIYPGDLIVVAGATNAGKTAFLLNLVLLNWQLFPVRYLTSELSEVRLTLRLHRFCEVHGMSLDDWDRHVNFISREGNFASAIDPTGLNVIDYLEIYKEFQEVGMPIKGL
jgi:hypothetical protein